MPNDLQTGHSPWSFSTNGAIDTPVTAVGDLVFVTSEDRSVYAIDARSRKMLWQHAMADYSDYAPVSEEKTLILASRAGELVALDAENGRTLWHVVLDGTPFSKPRLFGRVIVLEISDHEIAAFAAKTGQRLWRYTSADVLTAPEIGAGDIVAGSSTGKVVALR